MSDAATLPMPAPPVIGESTRLGATMVLSVLLLIVLWKFLKRVLVKLRAFLGGGAPAGTGA